MDTGASSHLNFNASNLSTIFDKRLFPSVHVGDDKSIPITNTGHGIIPSHHRPLHLHNVLDYLTRHILLRCDSSGDLYPVTKPSTSPTAFLSISASMWHQRLGYPGDQVLRSLVFSHFISCNKEKSSHSHACQFGKHMKLPFHSSDSIVEHCFDIIHSDLWTSPIISSRGIVKPVDRLSLNTFSISPIPKNPFDALKDPQWRNAMYDKYNALIKNGTWLLVLRPAGVNMVRSMWLFKHKFHADGTLSRYKARLVANGSSQQLGVDLDETFSPVVKQATIRTVISLAVSLQWPIHQLDVKNAFLNGDLSETVYMHQPPGFVNSRYPHHVCLLQRSLYGFKQAPRAWFQRFASYATQAGFYHSHCDSSLFICRQGSQVAYLLIYMDDIILTAPSLTLLQHIIASLHKEFDMTDLGALNYFLGISADRSSTEFKLGPEGVPIQDPTLYRSLAWGLQYLTFTHPDLSYVVQQVCLYMHDSREPYFAALKCILRYVRGTVDFGLQLNASATTSLVAKRQHTLSRSSAEVEYRGVANVVTKTAWLRNLLRELHSPLSTATLVYYDNVSGGEGKHGTFKNLSPLGS
ncbi:ribonuclease H-like domain-containing protein [Tanacetum coccineum]